MTNEAPDYFTGEEAGLFAAVCSHSGLLLLVHLARVYHLLQCPSRHQPIHPHIPHLHHIMHRFIPSGMQLSQDSHRAGACSNVLSIQHPCHRGLLTYCQALLIRDALRVVHKVSGVITTCPILKALSCAWRSWLGFQLGSRMTTLPCTTASDVNHHAQAFQTRLLEWPGKQSPQPTAPFKLIHTEKQIHLDQLSSQSTDGFSRKPQANEPENSGESPPPMAHYTHTTCQEAGP